MNQEEHNKWVRESALAQMDMLQYLVAISAINKPEHHDAVRSMSSQVENLADRHEVTS